MYYRLRMCTENGTEYYAYTTANNKEEAREAIRDELLQDEKEDRIIVVVPISEKEYDVGYKQFAYGERSLDENIVLQEV